MRGNDGFKTVKVPLTPAPLFLVSHDADGKVRHASVSDATLPGFDCDQKPFVWPLMVLGE